MASPESLVKALAHGLIEALLANGQEKAKKERPIVAKTEEINAAVRAYLDNLAAQETPPEQQDLFHQPEVDLSDAIYDRVQEARARAEAQDRVTDEPQPGTYRPDMPDEGKTWQSPIP